MNGKEWGGEGEMGVIGRVKGVGGGCDPHHNKGACAFDDPHADKGLLWTDYAWAMPLVMMTLVCEGSNNYCAGEVKDSDN